MNIETFHLPAFLSIIIALTAFLVTPAAAMAGSKIPEAPSANRSESPDGAACDLPPVLEVDGSPGGSLNADQPFLDKRADEKFKTATFAMG